MKSLTFVIFGLCASILCFLAVIALSSGFIFTGPKNQNQVYFSFDDGPSEHTLEILNILDIYDAKATFFVLCSKAKEHPDIIAEIQKRGHRLGYHSTHHNMALFTPAQDIIKEFSDCSFDSTIYRPPYGVPSLFSPELNTKGYSTILWSLNSKDYNSESSQEIIQRVTSKSEAGDIILFHDGVPASKFTVDALPSILEDLQKKNLKAVSLFS